MREERWWHAGAESRFGHGARLIGSTKPSVPAPPNKSSSHATTASKANHQEISKREACFRIYTSAKRHVTGPKVDKRTKKRTAHTYVRLPDIH